MKKWSSNQRKNGDQKLGKWRSNQRKSRGRTEIKLEAIEWHFGQREFLEKFLSRPGSCKMRSLSIDDFTHQSLSRTRVYHASKNSLRGVSHWSRGRRESSDRYWRLSSQKSPWWRSAFEGWYESLRGTEAGPLDVAEHDDGLMTIIMIRIGPLGAAWATAWTVHRGPQETWRGHTSKILIQERLAKKTSGKLINLEDRGRTRWTHNHKGRQGPPAAKFVNDHFESSHKKNNNKNNDVKNEDNTL